MISWLEVDGSEDNDSLSQASLSKLPHHTTCKGESDFNFSFGCKKSTLIWFFYFSGYQLDAKLNVNINVSGVAGGKTLGWDGYPLHRCP